MLRSLAQLNKSDFHEDQQLEALHLLQFAEGRLRPVKGRAKGKSKRQKVAHSVITVVNWVSSEQSTTPVYCCSAPVVIIEIQCQHVGSC
jgi:hypothetical protein